VDELGLWRLERLTFSVAVTTGIGYDPASRTYDFTNARIDVAPEQGLLWTYDARALRVTSFFATPPTPQAARTFALHLAAVRTSTGAVLTAGRVSCSSTFGGAPVRARIHRFVGKEAVCVFDVPSSAKGQRFRSTIAVTRGDARVARSVSGRVR
jgi:hypothetical protein